MKKLSVIIPCYNAERYVSQCLEQTVNQTLDIEDMEIILINDGSTDNTSSILEEWEKRYPDTILIIHLEDNCGPGIARNIALTYASGEYVSFIDVDDIFVEAMFEKMLSKAYKYQCDMVVCRNLRTLVGQEDSISWKETGKQDVFLSIIDGAERGELIRADINQAVWNKIYRLETIKTCNILFAEHHIYEDRLFTALIKHYMKRVYILEEYLYSHTIRPDSLSNSVYDINKKLDWFYVDTIVIRQLRERDLYHKFSEHYEEEFFINFFTIIKNLVKSSKDMDPEVLTLLKINTRELFPNYLSIPLVQKLLHTKGFYYEILSGMEQETQVADIQKLRLLL